MGFRSVNEIEKFSFEECQISFFKVEADLILLEAEALIVKPENSQNENFTESFAATTQIKLIGGKIVSGVKEGFRYYDANDVLLKEVSDVALTSQQLAGFPSKCAGAYLFSMNRRMGKEGIYTYAMEIEFSDEDNTMSDSYEIIVEFEKAVFEWENYMNRVER